MGIEQDVVYLFGYTNKVSPELNKIIRSKDLKSEFYVFKDEREKRGYAVSLSPHLFEKFCRISNIMETETIFHTDPDVIFTKKMDLEKYDRDAIWYLSNTQSYLHSPYIKSKSPELFKRMCEIVKIDPTLVEKNDKNTGGAQYILKKTNEEYWHKCYNDSEDLYKLMNETSNIYNPKHPIQKWTASMWAFLWNAWYFGHETKVVKELDFSWATSEISSWDKLNIFHNAGITKVDDIHFYKAQFNVKSPFGQEIKVSDTNCGYNFVKEIRETEKNFKELIF